jgi:hypothetical protein
MEVGTPLKVYSAVPGALKRRRMFPTRDRMQPTVGDYYKPYKSRDKRQQALDFQITMFLVRMNLPFNLIQHEAFKDLIKFLDPRATVKTPSTISKYKLPLLYENFKTEVEKTMKADLQNVNMAAFTTDFWSCRTGDHYLNLSIHYINKLWELRHFCAAFEKWEGRTTAPDVGFGLDQLVDLIDGLQTSCTTYCVTDAARNMIAGVRASDRIDRHFKCMDHLLQTSLGHAFGIHPLIVDAMKHATDLASHLHRSNYAHTTIKTEAQSMKGNLVTSFNEF